MDLSLIDIDIGYRVNRFNKSFYVEYRLVKVAFRTANGQQTVDQCLDRKWI